MILIKCINPQCSSPTNSFDRDETSELEEKGAIATPHEKGAVRVIAVCPFCGTENTVWVKRAKLTKIDEVIKRDNEGGDRVV